MSQENADSGYFSSDYKTRPNSLPPLDLCEILKDEKCDKNEEEKKEENTVTSLSMIPQHFTHKESSPLHDEQTNSHSSNCDSDAFDSDTWDSDFENTYYDSESGLYWYELFSYPLLDSP